MRKTPESCNIEVHMEAPTVIEQEEQTSTARFRKRVLSLIDNFENLIKVVEFQIHFWNEVNSKTRLHKNRTMDTFETENLVECTQEINSAEEFDQNEYYDFYFQSDFGEEEDTVIVEESVQQQIKQVQQSFEDQHATNEVDETLVQSQLEEEPHYDYSRDLALYQQRYYSTGSESAYTNQSNKSYINSFQEHQESSRSNCLRRSSNFYHISSRHAQLLQIYSGALSQDNLDNPSQSGFSYEFVNDINDLHKYDSTVTSIYSVFEELLSSSKEGLVEDVKNVVED